jgi:hypothetical protein
MNVRGRRVKCECLVVHLDRVGSTTLFTLLRLRYHLSPETLTSLSSFVSSHSTGRGGFANLFHRTNNSEDHSTGEKVIPRPVNESVPSGRGGAGNFVHS